MADLIPTPHPRFQLVDPDIFRLRLVDDCMTHSCVIREGDKPMLDACCQYGADTDLLERDAILARRDQIAPLMRPEAAAAPWFTTEEHVDKDFPSGRLVRTAPFGDGCVFLQHDLRGCAIHRASLEQGWDFNGVKPHICRLFPLTYDHDSIVISDDYQDYSCAFVPTAPTLYRVQRPSLAAIFGDDVVAALDQVEAQVQAADAAIAARKLPVV